MTKKEIEEQIERWATLIIPTVFRAEDTIVQEWMGRLKDVKPEDTQELAEAYCRAIAENIVLTAINNKKEKQNETTDSHQGTHETARPEEKRRES